MLSKRPVVEWDAAALLALMWETWNQVFRQNPRSCRAWPRRRIAGASHQVGPPGAISHRRRLPGPRLGPPASDVGVCTPGRRRRDNENGTAPTALQRTGPHPEAPHRHTGGGDPDPGGLPPWREVVSPHQTWPAGQYQQAEFAADLWQVYLGGGVTEYQDPIEFFRRTF